MEEREIPVVPVVDRSFARTLPLPSDLLAFQDVEIHARVQGFIQSIAVDRGSVVRRGALLARIDAPELKAQLSEAEAKVQSAEARLLEAQAALTSERSTFDRLTQAARTPGVVAGNDVEVAQQKVEAAKARVDAATRNVEAMRQAARAVRDVEAYLQITAPFDGVVTERSAHVGSLVGPSSAAIVRMQQISTLRVVAGIPEAYIAGASVGQPIEFTVATFPGETFVAKLARVARALDPKRGDGRSRGSVRQSETGRPGRGEGDRRAPSRNACSPGAAGSEMRVYEKIRERAFQLMDELVRKQRR